MGREAGAVGGRCPGRTLTGCPRDPQPGTQVAPPRAWLMRTEIDWPQGRDRLFCPAPKDPPQPPHQGRLTSGPVVPAPCSGPGTQGSLNTSWQVSGVTPTCSPLEAGREQRGTVRGGQQGHQCPSASRRSMCFAPRTKHDRQPRTDGRQPCSRHPAGPASGDGLCGGGGAAC